MQEMKRQGKAHEGADSERAVRMFFIARKVGLTPAGLRDNYDAFLARQEELQQLYIQKTAVETKMKLYERELDFLL